MTDLRDFVRGCTFDDFLFTPQYSVLERRDPAAIDLSCRLSERLTLKRPIVSANMDTVTRAEMAIAVAEEGGIGIIDRGFRSGDIEPQIREVERVKRRQHGIIADPYTISPAATLGEAAEMMRRTGVGSLVVVDWKTDRARSTAEIDAAAHRYRAQGAAYALALSAATGRQVAAVRFVFCRAGGEPAVERAITDLDVAVAEVEAALVGQSRS